MNYDDFNKQVYGMKLKQHRITADLNQTELAAILKVPQSMIARYESGKVMPELATMKKIARALDTDLSEFFDNDCIFNIRESDLGVTYELTEVEPESRDGAIYKVGSIDDFVDDLDEKDRWLIMQFALKIKARNNQEEFFNDRLTYHKVFLDEAKEALKDKKRLRSMQKIKAYMKSNQIDDESPFQEDIDKELEKENITFAELKERHDKEFDEFVRQERRKQLIKQGLNEEEIQKILESEGSYAEKQEKILADWTKEVQKSK